MITTLWIIGLIFFTLSLVFMTISDECVYRNKSIYEKWSLVFMLTAVTLFGTALYLTSQEEKGNVTEPTTGR